MLVLCGACRRHVKGSEEACPFCGSRLSPAKVTPPQGSGTRSRAQRYALGIAIAASIGIAKASGQESAPRAVAPPTTEDGGADADSAEPNALPRPPDDLEMYDRRRGGGDCATTGGGCCGGPAKVVCPPYGCVFPDEDCDLVRV